MSRVSETAYKLLFISRWYFWYNLELVFLQAAMPPGTPFWTSREARESAMALEERRKVTQQAIFARIKPYGSVCAACGACCKEEVNRFTAFDAVVRAAGPMPLDRFGRDILSLPWMVRNGVAHTWTRLVGAAMKRPLPESKLCEHLGKTGCSLAHNERPMLCASWFCPKYLRHMRCDDLKGMAPHLREMERLHLEAVRLARRNRRDMQRKA